MALVSETSVSIRFFGDDLRPAELTQALGKEPTTCTVKGEIIIGKTTRKCRVAKTGSWLFDVERREPGDLNGQILELFGALTSDLAIWRNLANRYNPDLFVGLFMNEPWEGFELSAQCLEILAARGVSLDFSIYGPSETASD